MKLLCAIFGLLFFVGCAEGELAGPGPGPDSSVVGGDVDARMGGFPDAAPGQPDARQFPDANMSFPDANTGGGGADAGLEICFDDTMCSTGCCLILVCTPGPGPCTPP